VGKNGESGAGRRGVDIRPLLNIPDHSQGLRLDDGQTGSSGPEVGFGEM